MARTDSQTLIAGFDVATGQVFGRIGDHRCETDLAAFLEGMLEGAAPDVCIPTKSATDSRLFATFGAQAYRAKG